MTTLDQAIIAELDHFADPVRRIANGPDGVQEILGRLGWDFTSVAADDVAAIAGAAGAIVDAVQTLISVRLPDADVQWPRRVHGAARVRHDPRRLRGWVIASGA